LPSHFLSLSLSLLKYVGGEREARSLTEWSTMVDTYQPKNAHQGNSDLIAHGVNVVQILPSLAGICKVFRQVQYFQLPSERDTIRWSPLVQTMEQYIFRLYIRKLIEGGT
jgi:hypothetical protein